MRRALPLLLLALLTGCTGGAGPGTPTAEPGAVVPWAARDAGPVPPWLQPPTYDTSGPPPGTPACTEEDVAVALERPQPGSYELLLSATRTCALQGALRTDVLAPDGTVLLPGEEGRSPGRLLRPGGELRALTRWPSGCGVPATVALRVAYGPTVLRVPDVPAPGCRPGGTVTPVAQDLPAVVDEPPPVPAVPWDVLQVALDESSWRNEDGTLHYTVVLTNPTGTPVPLDPCPVYTAALGEGGTGVQVRSRLNCEQAPAAVAPGQRLGFAMELPLGEEFGPAPASAHLEPEQTPRGWGWSWGLEPQRAGGSVSSPVDLDTPFSG